MKIVVTGALGHIGSKLIRKLPQFFPGIELILIDDLSTQRYCSLFNLPEKSSVKFIEGRIQNISFDFLEGVDCVIHLAAVTDAAGTAENPQLVFENNYTTTELLSKLCDRHHIPIIYPSSTSVYGSQDKLVDENCRNLQPQSPYADCKIKEENFLKELFKKGLLGVICRFGTIYGTSPGMRFHTAVNKFCWQANFHQSITVWETAMDQKRPYLALDDAINAIQWIIEKKLYGGEIYNIVTSNHTVRDVIEEIKKFRPHLNVTLVQHKIMNQLSYEISSDKFKKTGFVFKGDLSYELQDTFNQLGAAYKSAI